MQATGPAPDVSGLRSALKQANNVAALTGAGISAEGGVPTFRGSEGLWRNYSPEKLATPQAFEENPQLVWEWYDWRRSVIHKASPIRVTGRWRRSRGGTWSPTERGASR
ncbi:MAG: Sir2 family NAD-dependent protein deacetylase [Terriglobia bacterium]